MQKEVLTPDAVLALLVNVMNSVPNEGSEADIGVTLIVNGTLVSGKLIPNWRWAELVRDQLADQVPYERDADGDYVGFSFLFDKAVAELIKKRDEDTAVRDALQNLPTRYQEAVSEEQRTWFIHLRGAKVWSPASESSLPTDGMLWRGRLSEVDGWTLGELGPQPSGATA